jgi:hypothetical protein
VVTTNTGTIFKSHRAAAGVLARYLYKHPAGERETEFPDFIIPVGEREHDRVVRRTGQ